MPNILQLLCIIRNLCLISIVAREFLGVGEYVAIVSRRSFIVALDRIIDEDTMDLIQAIFGDTDNIVHRTLSF